MTLEQRLSLLITAIGTDHKSQATQIADVLNKLGTLTNLSTTAKTSLVNAINEVYAIAQSGSNVIDDLQTASLVKTYSITKIKSEIAQLKSDLLGGVPAVAFDTLKEIADYIGTDQTATSGMTVAIGNRVSYTQADNKTVSEKTQARANIDAYGSVEIGNPDADLVALYTTAKA